MITSLTQIKGFMWPITSSTQGTYSWLPDKISYGHTFLLLNLSKMEYNLLALFCLVWYISGAQNLVRQLNSFFALRGWVTHLPCAPRRAERLFLLKNTYMDRPIAFYPELARELGGIEEALFYQQISYWSDKGGRQDGFIYKSMVEIEDETTLTRYQQDRVRNKLVKLGWLEVKKLKANGAPTLHYKPIVMVSLICKKLTNGNVRNLQMRNVRNLQIHNKDHTENTTDILSAVEKQNCFNKGKNFVEQKKRGSPSFKETNKFFPVKDVIS